MWSRGQHCEGGGKGEMILRSASRMLIAVIDHLLWVLWVCAQANLEAGVVSWLQQSIERQGGAKIGHTTIRLIDR